MKQQVIVLHGGEAFDSYKEYLRFLKGAKLDTRKGKGWKAGLPDKLGRNFEVILTKMPNPFNAKYKEWKIWFNKYIPQIKDNAIFVGHSLGGIFLIKYFSEVKYDRKIKALMLVAAPYNTKGKHPLADFNINAKLNIIQESIDKIFLYHSKGDKVVPINNMYDYKKALPKAIVKKFVGRGHFTDNSFPELVREIKRLV